MNVTVKRIGNELAVVLPEDVARRLNASEGATLTVTETDSGISLGAATVREGVQPELMAVYQTSHERFGLLYQKLAE